MTDTWVSASDPAATSRVEPPAGRASVAAPVVVPIGDLDEAGIIDHARYVSALQTMHRARCDSLREFLG